MSTQYDLREGDNTLIEVTCRDPQGNVIDLTGAQVKFIWNDKDGTLVKKSGAIKSPPTDGKAEYRFQSGEIYAPEIDVAYEITDAVGNVFGSLATTTFKVRTKKQ